MRTRPHRTNTQQFNNADELCWTVSGTSRPTPAAQCSDRSDHVRLRQQGQPDHVGARHRIGTCDTYDQANLLTAIKTGTGSTCTTPTTVGTYAYDGDGMRESKTVSGTTTHFTWDGSGGNLLQQYDGTTKTSFIYGPGGIPVEQIAGSTTTYLHHDQHRQHPPDHRLRRRDRHGHNADLGSIREQRLHERVADFPVRVQRAVRGRRIGTLLPPRPLLRPNNRSIPDRRSGSGFDAIALCLRRR